MSPTVTRHLRDHQHPTFTEGFVVFVTRAAPLGRIGVWPRRRR